MTERSATPALRAGDLLAFRSEDGTWTPGKILVLDLLPMADGEHGIAHVALYEPQERCPSVADFAALKPRIRHVPIDAGSVARDATVLGTMAVAPGELEGFHAYLKATDFQRYLEATGQDADEVLKRASEAFNRGNALAGEKRFEAAIAAYTQAYELFPPFYEALDNRAFAFMDLGRWDDAIADWQESLGRHPDNNVAAFSLGECYLRQGRADRAVPVFEECVRRWPNEPRNAQFLEIAQLEARKT